MEFLAGKIHRIVKCHVWFPEGSAGLRVPQNPQNLVPPRSRKKTETMPKWLCHQCQVGRFEHETNAPGSNGDLGNTEEWQGNDPLANYQSQQPPSNPSSNPTFSTHQENHHLWVSSFKPQTRKKIVIVVVREHHCIAVHLLSVFLHIWNPGHGWSGMSLSNDFQN